MTYRLEIDVNLDSEYNADLYFDDYAEMVFFTKILLEKGCAVKIEGVFDNEE